MKLWYQMVLMCIAVLPLQAQRAIPDDNLGYPVLIKLSGCGSDGHGSGSASGFYLNSGSELYLVTARHVLFDLDSTATLQPGQAKPSPQCKHGDLISYSKDPKDKKQNWLRLDLDVLNASAHVKAHAYRDVAVVGLGPIQNSPNDATGKETITNVFPGVIVISRSETGLLDAGLETVKRFDDVLTGNDVYVFGYPASIGLQQSPQIDYNRPLLRKGLIAGTNDQNRTIVLDSTIFFGNSGGPVLQAVPVGFGRRFEIIGVVSQYVPFAEQWINQTMRYANTQIYNSGYSIAEPMDGVLELLSDQAPKGPTK